MLQAVTFCYNSFLDLYRLFAVYCSIRKGSKNMIELECKTDECEETLMCDEGVVAVTCSNCVNELIISMN